MDVGHGTPHDTYRRPPGVDPMAPVVEGPARHVWVTMGHDRIPGLHFEWRQHRGAWEARVTYMVRRGDGWATVNEWLPADRIGRA